MIRIDINCDLGEGATADDCAHDARIMRYISRANIACGGHAGNATTMVLSLENARKHGIAAGVHPGYPDPENFGRVSLAMEPEALLAALNEQITTLHRYAQQQDVTLEHIKLHGALYNDAEASDELARCIVRFVREEFPQLKILGLANAAMETAAADLGHPFLREGFMDRRYLNRARLAPRTLPNSVIENFDDCLLQVLALVHGTTFSSIEGDALAFAVDSICLHGDTAGAENIARELHRQLAFNGIQIAAADSAPSHHMNSNNEAQ